MKWDDFFAAFEDAKNTTRQADRIAHQMVVLLLGRLRTVPGYALSGLKRELRDFNMQTKRWKS